MILAWGLIRIWNKRVELLAEIDRQKDELLGIVSHQLAAPITSFNWYLELMLDDEMEKNPEEMKQNLRSMKSIAADLAELVGLILDVSRFELGRIKVERQEVQLNEFFDSIFDVVEPKAAEKKIRFTKAVDTGLGGAMLDKRLTRMAVENLLTNAVKYTGENGEVTLLVRRSGDVLRCEVRDTGLGIPEKEQSQIFGKLFRASNVTDVSGNGFGLYIAKGAVESQRGRIWFRSKEKMGTTFFIELPLSAAQESNVKKAA